MSSRVVVLSKRPSVVKSIYDINLDDVSTPINNRCDIKFNYYYDLLWKELE